MTDQSKALQPFWCGVGLHTWTVWSQSAPGTRTTGDKKEDVSVQSRCCIYCHLEHLRIAQ